MVGKNEDVLVAQKRARLRCYLGYNSYKTAVRNIWLSSSEQVWMVK